MLDIGQPLKCPATKKVHFSVFSAISARDKKVLIMHMLPFIPLNSELRLLRRNAAWYHIRSLWNDSHAIVTELIHALLDCFRQ